jgi:hypothetical protein
LRGKVRNGQRTAIGTDDITEERTVHVGHSTHTHDLGFGLHFTRASLTGS